MISSDPRVKNIYELSSRLSRLSESNDLSDYFKLLMAKGISKMIMANAYAVELTYHGGLVQKVNIEDSIFTEDQVNDVIEHIKGAANDLAG